MSMNGYALTKWSLLVLCASVVLAMPPRAAAQEGSAPQIPGAAEQQQPAPVPETEQKFEPVQLEPQPEDAIDPMVQDSAASGEVLQPMNEQAGAAPAPLPGQGPVVGVTDTQNQGQKTEEDLFYDANSLIPQGEIGQRAGPRKLDPRNQPASSLVIVTDKQGSNTVNAQLVAAQRAQALGLYDSAAQIYEDLYKKNKRDDRILMGRAIMFQHMGQFNEAIAAYQQLLDKSPNNKEAQINMLGLMTEKYPSVALRRLLDLEKEQGKSAGLAAQIAVAYAKLGNFKEALGYLGVAASMEPANAAHVFNIAVIADRSGNIDMAKTYYEKALDVDSINGNAEGVPRDVIYERLAKLR